MSFESLDSFISKSGSASDNIQLDTLSFIAIDTTILSSTIGSCSTTDTIIVRYQISDSSGLMDTASVIILRVDTVPPVLSAVDTLSMPYVELPSSFAHLDSLLKNNGTASDNCGLDTSSFMVIDTVICNTGSEDCFIIDTVKVRYSVSDLRGLSDTCTQIVLRSYLFAPDTLYIMTCNSYTVPSGDETYTNTGIYVDTLPNRFGCDSIIIIDLFINTDPLICGFNPCQDIINITDTFLANDPHQAIFEAATEISVFGVVSASESLIFGAGNSVVLIPDFEVQYGAEISIQIQPCVEE